MHQYSHTKCYRKILLTIFVFLKKIGKGKIDAIKYAQALKKDGKISEDICLLFDEMYLQKCEEYFGGELIGFHKNGELFKEIVCFMIVRLKEFISCDQVISRSNNAQKQSSRGNLKKRCS